MPYFRATSLPPSFLEAFDAPTQKDTRAYRLTVLSSESRARSLLLLVRLVGRDRLAALPDWNSTQLGSPLSDELRVDSLRYVCLYDSADDNFHTTAVNPRRNDQFGAMSGVVGWKDLEDQFELRGVTHHGNLVLFALDGALCRSRSVGTDQLPA